MELKLFITCVDGDVKQFCDEITRLPGPPSQEKGAPVGVREQLHVDQDLVAKHIDVQLVGHVSDELHEQLILVQRTQIATR